MIEAETGQNLITDEEIDFIHALWSEEISGHSKAKTLTVFEINKEK